MLKFWPFRLATRSSKMEYQDWSKDALIEKIRQLEVSSEKCTTDISGQNSAAAIKTVKKVKKELDFNNYSKRRIALKFAYLGWDYHGLAYQKQGHKTVEGEIIKALHKTKCIQSLDPADCLFSRCGRTDADVSAMAQVISLEVRSVIKKEDHDNNELDSKELDYVRILNSNLPPSIIFYAVCLHPPTDFDARFSCLSRKYRYFFDPNNLQLDLDLMQKGAQIFLGEQDFRNFCKVDGSKQINNFKRTILKSDIVRTESGICYFELQGTAFLWNQVRSMMAILFLVGQKLEPLESIKQLLDVEKQPRRPVYEIAWGVPLVLYDCEYSPMDWQIPDKVDLQRLELERGEMLMKLNMTETMLDLICNRTGQQDREGKKSNKYLPLRDRQLCDLPEVINAKWLARKVSKENATTADK